MSTAYPTLNFGLGEEIDMLRDSVWSFAQSELAPRAESIDKENAFPNEMWKKLGDLGLLGITVSEEYGGSGMGYLAHCVAMEEISRASASVGLSYGAHSNLCVNQIYKNANAAQKEKYLPKLCSGEHIGALAMSEPGAGSDVVSMKLRAEKKGDKYILNGNKMWITNGTIADVALVWAKDDDGVVRGFLIEKGMEGFSAPEQHGKLSLRASITSELVLENVRVPDSARLPNVEGLKGPLSCLTQARYGITWGVIGAAVDCYETALDYSLQRKQFSKPIAGYQMTQAKLVEMLTHITEAQLLVLRLGRMKDEGTMDFSQVSMAKRANVAMARDIARTSREILGANGIIDDYSPIRHMANMETVYTYEGTHEMHTLILGEKITGHSAFD